MRYIQYDFTYESYNLNKRLEISQATVIYVMQNSFTVKWVACFYMC